MNVLFLDSIDRETYGGMEEWIRLVTNGLAERGHKCLVVGRPESAFLRRVKSLVVSTAPLAISGDFNPLTISRLRQLLFAHEIDLVCVNFTKDIRLGGLAARWAGAAKVVWSVGLDITKNTFAHRWLTPKLIDGVVVPSDSLKRQITALGYIRPESVSVVPIGIEDTEGTVVSPVVAAEIRIKLKLPSESIIAVTVGRFVEQKGHTTLIDALPTMLQSSPDLYCLFIGSGPLEEDLRARAEALGVLQHVVFGGMVDDVTPFIAGADLMIHPSVEEPFGIAVLEGMRASLPIVASNVGGIPEVVGSGGGTKLVEARNPSELAGAVTSLVRDRAKMRKSGELNRQRFIEKFSLQVMIDRVESAFSRITSMELHRG